MGYPIQLNFTLNKDGIITGDDVHDSITTNYYDIKVDRDKMNGSWKQLGTDFEGVFNITLKYDEKKNKIFDGTWKDTKRPYGHGAYRGKKLTEGETCKK